MVPVIHVDARLEPDFWDEYLGEFVFAEVAHVSTRVQPDEIGGEPGVVIVYRGFDSRPEPALLAALARSPRHALVHLCDERLQHDARHYREAAAVFRCYYDPRLSGDNVYAIPPGFQTGLRNRTPVNFDMKHLVWFFAGQVKSHRRAMLAEFRRLTPFRTHLTGQWADPRGLSPDEMAALYRRAIFAPCPVGYRNPDSFRILECLEYGCIPVVVTFLGEDYFRYVYGDHPFIIASSWAKATAEIHGLLAHPPSLRARQSRTQAWREAFRSNLALDVRDILAGAPRERLRSRQFQYQAAGMSISTQRRYRFYFGHGLLRRLYRAVTHSMS